VSDAARNDGALLPDLIDKTITGSQVWADTAYRSQKNETQLASSHIRDPSQKAERQADAEAHRQSQCRQIKGARQC
jgi:hypothetical protein